MTSFSAICSVSEFAFEMTYSFRQQKSHDRERGRLIMNKRIVTLRIRSELITEIRSLMTGSISDAPDCTDGSLVRMALGCSILYCVNYNKMNRNIEPSKIRELDKEDKHNKGSNIDKRISIRASEDELALLKNFYGTEKNSMAIRCALRDFISGNERSMNLLATEKICCLTGQKNPEMCEFINNAFESISSKTEITEYDEPFTGTANVFLHNNIDSTDATLNEFDELRYNLLTVIRDYPLEFKIEILSHKADKDYFEECKRALNGIYKSNTSSDLNLHTKKGRITAATMYYLLFNCSHYGKGGCFIKNTSQDTYRQRADAISAIHTKLKNVSITNTDALHLLRRKKCIENALFYFDPPYINSEQYYTSKSMKGKVFKDHQQLRDCIEELSQNNICFISYRVTASATMKKKGYTTKKLRHKLNDLYANRGFHFALKKLTGRSKQVEILICNRPFAGSKPYGTAQFYLEVAKYA